MTDILFSTFFIPDSLVHVLVHDLFVFTYFSKEEIVVVHESFMPSFELAVV